MAHVRHRWLLVIMALVLVSALAACGGSSGSGGGSGSGASPSASTGSADQGSGSQGAGQDPKFIRFVASTPGGTWYPPATAMLQIIDDNISGVSTRLLPGGSSANTKTVGDGEAELGYTHAAIAGQAYKGAGNFEKAYTDINYLFTTTPAAIHFAVRKDSDIRSIADLKNKRIGMAPQGYLANDIAVEIFQTYGFTLDDVVANGGSVSYLGLTEGPQSLIDGHVDVYLGVGVWPYTPYVEIDFNPGVRFLSLEDDMREKFLAEYDWYSAIDIPKDAYKSLEEDMKTVGSYVSVIVNANLSEDLVYRITKAIWENIDKVHDVSPVDKEWMKLEDALKGATIPAHPGAQKYYDEMGIKGDN